MIGIVFAMALAAPLSAQPPELRAEPRFDARLDIPDEIAPAVVPYMRCLLASAGVPSYADGRLLDPPPGIRKGSDCRPVRIKAAKDADKMLKRAKGGSRAERSAFIERVLVSMDKFIAGPPLPPEPLAPTV